MGKKPVKTAAISQFVASWSMASRCIRLVFGLIVFVGDRLLWRLSGRNCPGSCVIVNYHVMRQDCVGRFSKQLDALQRIAKTISAVKKVTFEPGGRYVGITFDDAFCSFVKYALPELVRRNIPATLFVPTGYLGRKAAWVDYGGENPVSEEVVSVVELKELRSTT